MKSFYIIFTFTNNKNIMNMIQQDTTIANIKVVLGETTKETIANNMVHEVPSMLGTRGSIYAQI